MYRVAGARGERCPDIGGSPDRTVEAGQVAEEVPLLSSSSPACSAPTEVLGLGGSETRGPGPWQPPRSREGTSQRETQNHGGNMPEAASRAQGTGKGSGRRGRWDAA